MTVTSLGYLGLETSKVDEWSTFASDVVGLAVGAPDADGVVPLRMDERPARFFLHHGETERIAYIGWEVAAEADLEEHASALIAAGAPVRRGTADECARRRVTAMVRTVDPAGHELELFTGPEVASEPFVSPRAISGFRTGDLGLGHLVVNVERLPVMLAFYLDVLGFRLSDRLAEALYFLRCNSRHHSIGVASIPGPPRPLHVMLEVDSFDDVGSTLDICIDRRIRVSSIGLHTNDRMTSFYLQTPSGFEIEYGWNGLLVDEASWETGVIDRPSVWGHHQLDPERPPGPRAFRKLTT